MKGFSFRCVKNDPGTVSHPRGATDAARRHAVTRIRFYYRTISAPALQETGLLSHRLFLSFRKKMARIYRNRFKNACVRLSPAFRQRILVFAFVVFWHEKTGDQWCPYGDGGFGESGQRREQSNGRRVVAPTERNRFSFGFGFAAVTT